MLPRPEDYKLASSTYSILLPDEPGIYVLQIVPDSKEGKGSENFIYLTRFKALTMALPGNNNEVVVLDAKTGNPVANAEVIFYSTYYIGKDNKEVERKTTDEAGKAV
ncbi:MAG: hypothetical protein V8Q76_17085 [Bacteroides intestinalis]